MVSLVFSGEIGMAKPAALERFDNNKNGFFSRAELEIAEQVLEIELREEKAKSQKLMAWVALWAMIVFTLFLLSPLISDSRLEALADLFGLFYIAGAGIIGAFMGVTAWMSNQATNRPYGYYQGYEYDGSDQRGMLQQVPKEDPAP